MNIVKLIAIATALLIAPTTLADAPPPAPPAPAAPEAPAKDVQRVLSLSGCLCQGCASKLEVKLMKVEGIKKANFEVKKGRLTIVSSAKVTDEQIKKVVATTRFKLNKMGKPVPVKPESDKG